APAIAYRWAKTRQPIYKSTSTSSAKVATLASGAKVQWLRNYGSWSSVSVSGKTGWIQSKHLGATAPLKVIGSRWSIDTTVVRATPSSKAKSLGSIPAGQQLSLSPTSGSWAKAKTERKR